MDLIARTLDGLHVGDPVTFETLTMWPLLGEDAVDAPYFTLDEALAQGLLTVTEVSEQGRVPELSVVNQAERRVLLVDGEELVGAKQNRVINLTILVPASKTTVIPVSCVEAGRWARRSHAFGSSPRVHYASGRARKTSQVSLAMAAFGEHRADQADVWADIAAKSDRLGARSETDAMSMMYEAHHTSLEEYVRALPPRDRQRGAVFVVAEGVMGVDLFDRAQTFARLQPKLVRSFALDAIDRVADEEHPGDPNRHAPIGSQGVRRFLEAVVVSRAEEFVAVGEGRDVRLTGPQVAGAALVAEGTVVHMHAFGAAADFRQAALDVPEGRS